MAFLAAAPLALIGAGVSAVGTVVGGIASANQSRYQAQVAENNAKIARQNATAAEQAGAEQAANVSRKGAAQVGEIIASQAANGVDVNSGTAVDVQTSQRVVNKQDTANTLRNAEMQAYGYRTQGTSFDAQAKLDKNAAAMAPISAAIGATGSLLGSASSLGKTWTGSDNSVLGNI